MPGDLARLNQRARKGRGAGASQSHRHPRLSRAGASIVWWRIGEGAPASGTRRCSGRSDELSSSGSSGRQLLASEGKRAEALREMDGSLEKLQERRGLAYFCEGIAAVYATLSNTNKALDWLDRAVRAGDLRGRVVSAQSSAGEHRAAAAFQANRRVNRVSPGPEADTVPIATRMRVTCYRCSSNMLRL